MRLTTAKRKWRRNDIPYVELANTFAFRDDTTDQFVPENKIKL
jgi:hypothetical protein